MENIDFMQELYKIVLDWIKRQASQVVLLSLAIIAMYQIGTLQLQKQEAKIEKQEVLISSLSDEIRKCDMERAQLQTQVDFMRFRLNEKFPNIIPKH